MFGVLLSCFVVLCCGFYVFGCFWLFFVVVFCGWVVFLGSVVCCWFFYGLLCAWLVLGVWVCSRGFGLVVLVGVLMVLCGLLSSLLVVERLISFARSLVRFLARWWLEGSGG